MIRKKKYIKKLNNTVDFLDKTHANSACLLSSSVYCLQSKQKKVLDL